MKIRVVSVGTVKDTAIKRLIDYYTTRIQCRLSHICVKTVAHVKPYLTNNTYLLEERGTLFSSPNFAQLLYKKTTDGATITFIIGPAEGFSSGLSDSYASISLSTLTFPHELAQLLLFEQIYRAEMILAGKAYHK